MQLENPGEGFEKINKYKCSVDMDEESYDDTDDFDEDEAPKPRKTLMNMIRRRTQHRPSHGS